MLTLRRRRRLHDRDAVRHRAGVARVADRRDGRAAIGRRPRRQASRWTPACGSGVVVTEVALSFILLIGAGLMLRSFVALGRVHPGFDPNHVLTLLPAVAAARSRRSARRSTQQLRERLQAIPGVSRRDGGDAAAARRRC